MKGENKSEEQSLGLHSSLKNSKRAKEIIPRSCEELKEQIDAIRNGKGKRHQKLRLISELVKRTLAKRGFFCKVENGTLRPDLYYFDKHGRELFKFTDEPGSTDPRFLAYLQDLFGLSQKDPETAWLLGDLQLQATRDVKSIRPHKLWYWDEEHLYLNFHRGRILRIDERGKGKWIPNGKEVFFIDTDLPEGELPKQPHSPNKILRELFPFEDHGVLTAEEQGVCFLLWAYTLPFGAALGSKPILLLQGEAGSGKTTLFKVLSALFYGDRTKFSLIGKGDERDFLTTIANNPLCLFDNVELNTKWLEDHLASLSTGSAIRTRKLYADVGQELVIRPETWIVLNGISPRVRRPDVADRLLILNFHRLSEHERRPESEIVDWILEYRGELLRGYVSELKRIVKRLATSEEEFESPIRMEDWAKLAWQISGHFGCRSTFESALEKVSHRQSEYALEDDPLFSAVSIWMERERSQRDLTASLLLRELSVVAEREGIDLSYGRKPLNAISLGKRLNQLKGNFAQVGIRVVVTKASSNKKLYEFHRETD